jgi:glycosyltransferase involved in cell wall biosynthesis
LNNHPLITVIVATKNSSSTLLRCINSFTDQIYQNKELIIIDGGSSDATLRLLNDNAHSIHYWESKPDRGIAHAWNKALVHANGEWIIFLGSDDWFTDTMVLDEFCRKIRDHSLENSRIVYAQIRRILSKGNCLDIQGMDWHIVRKIFFSEKMMIPHPACFHHCSVFKQFGRFDEEFFIAVDYEFLLRVLKNEEAVFLPDFIVTNMAFGGMSSRISNLLTMQMEGERALRKHGFKPGGYKRICNILIYRLLGLLTKIGGEQLSARILDRIRIALGKNPVWTRQ